MAPGEPEGAAGQRGGEKQHAEGERQRERGIGAQAGEGDRPLAKRDPQRPRESEAAKTAKANSSGGTTRGTPRVQRIVIEG